MEDFHIGVKELCDLELMLFYQELQLFTLPNWPKLPEYLRGKTFDCAAFIDLYKNEHHTLSDQLATLKFIDSQIELVEEKSTYTQIKTLPTLLRQRDTLLQDMCATEQILRALDKADAEIPEVPAEFLDLDDDDYN